MQEFEQNMLIPLLIIHATEFIMQVPLFQREHRPLPVNVTLREYVEILHPNGLNQQITILQAAATQRNVKLLSAIDRNLNQIRNPPSPCIVHTPTTQHLICSQRTTRKQWRSAASGEPFFLGGSVH